VALICDTGVLYAAIDEFDADHGACAELLLDPPEELAVPAPVVVEREWLVASRMGFDQFDGFLQSVELGALDVVALEIGDYGRIREAVPPLRRPPARSRRRLRRGGGRAARRAAPGDARPPPRLGRPAAARVVVHTRPVAGARPSRLTPWAAAPT